MNSVCTCLQSSSNTLASQKTLTGLYHFLTVNLTGAASLWVSHWEHWWCVSFSGYGTSCRTWYGNFFVPSLNIYMLLLINFDSLVLCHSCIINYSLPCLIIINYSWPVHRIYFIISCWSWQNAHLRNGESKDFRRQNATFFDEPDNQLGDPTIHQDPAYWPIVWNASEPASPSIAATWLKQIRVYQIVWSFDCLIHAPHTNWGHRDWSGPGCRSATNSPRWSSSEHQ